MNNPQTIDRRDVAHPTNPIGGHRHIEEDEDKGPAEPLNAKAARPSHDRDAAKTNIPRDTRS